MVMMTTRNITEDQRQKIRLQVIKRLGSVCAKGCGEPVTSYDALMSYKGKVWHAKCDDAEGGRAIDIQNVGPKDLKP
jgi:hypothetical protein